MNEIANIAVLAHIDAGKTTLSERLLFHGKRIDVMGEVEEGLSTLDYLPEERKRGITIEAGYSRFEYKNRQFNLIDTPGHIDFGVEVDAALEAVESAILVISGVRGVQTQTMTHWRKLREKKIPVLALVNKMDQSAHQSLDILIEIEEALDQKPLVLCLPLYENSKLVGVLDVIHQKQILPKASDSREVLIRNLSSEQELQIKPYRQELLEQCALASDALMEKFLEDREISAEEILAALAIRIQSLECVPVLFGSAKISVGLRSLLNALRYLFPAFQSHRQYAAGQIVKARFRKDIGRYYLYKALAAQNLTGVKWFEIHAEELEDCSAPEPGVLCAVQSEYLWKMGDKVDAGGQVISTHSEVYLPLLKYSIEPEEPEQYSVLQSALELIRDTDPSLVLEKDEDGGCWEVSVVGEVFLDVLASRLRDEFGCAVRTGMPKVRCLESLKSEKNWVAEAHGPNGLYRLDFSLSSSVVDELILPEQLAQVEMVRAVLESVMGELHRKGFVGQGEAQPMRLVVNQLSGPEHLLPVPIKKMVLDALRLNLNEGDVLVLEPWIDVNIQVPNDTSGLVLDDLRRRGANIVDVVDRGAWLHLGAEMPLNKSFGYATDLRSVTKGHASWNMSFKEYKSRV